MKLLPILTLLPMALAAVPKDISKRWDVPGLHCGSERAIRKKPPFPSRLTTHPYTDNT